MTHRQQSTIFLVRREAVFPSSPASTLTWLRSRSGTPFNIKRNASSGDSSFLPHPQNRLKSKRRSWTAECKNLDLVPFRTKNQSELWGPSKVLNLYRLGQRVGWWTEISIIWSCKALLYEPTNGLYRNIVGGYWCRAFAEFDLNPLLSMKQYVSEVVLLGIIFMMFVNTMEWFKTKVLTICLPHPQKSRTHLEFGSSPNSQRSMTSLIGSFKRRRPKLAVIFCQRSSRINAELKPEMTEDPYYEWSGVGIVALLGYCVSTLVLVLNFDRMTPILCLTIQLLQRCWNPRLRFWAISGALENPRLRCIRKMNQTNGYCWTSSSATKFPATISTSMSCGSGNWMSCCIYFIFTPNDFKQKGGETPSFHQNIQNSWQ